MATYYVDPAATGSETGADWTNAFTSMQDADSVAVSGDNIYLRGTETLTSSITISADGDTLSGTINWIGCNSSGSDDGTHFTLDGDGTAAICLSSNGGSYHRFKNIRCTGATDSGLGDSTADSATCTFINCSFDNNTNEGADCSSWPNSQFFLCKFNSNGTNGAMTNYTGLSRFVFCMFIGNGSNGVYQYLNSAYSAIYIGCIFAENTINGMYLAYGGAFIMNATIDDNGNDGIFGDFSNLSRGISIIGSRITNSGDYGVDDVSTGAVLGIYGWNFFNGNTSGNLSSEIDTTGALALSGTDTNTYTGTDGYNSPGSPDYDYNLTSSATMHDVEITLPS